MPAAKQMKVLMGGVEKWNKWRSDNREIPIDLSCALLDGADLHQANLAECDLTHAFLYDANLRGTQLPAAKLIGTNLCRAHLCGADLKGADLHREPRPRRPFRGRSQRRQPRTCHARWDQGVEGDLCKLPGIRSLRVGPRPEKREGPVQPPHHPRRSARANHGRQPGGRPIRLLAATQ
jgi:hypothetical protein